MRFLERPAGVINTKLSIVLLSLSLLLPALINGNGFVFFDTPAYVRGADAAIAQATGHTTPWSDRVSAVLARKPAAAGPSAATPTAAPAPAASPARPGKPAGSGDKVILSGRSVYYGFLLYLSLLANSLWPLVIVQAIVAATAIVLTLRRFAGPAGLPTITLAAAAVICVLTPVGFFVAFGMPDLFAPLAILAVANLALFWRDDRWTARLFWAALLTGGMLFHSATLLITIALLALLALWKLVLRRAPRIVLAPVAVAIVLAMAGEMAFGLGVGAITGNKPIRPPFLSARLIEDGPGARYLRTHCAPGSDLLLCRFKDRPVQPSDRFLWSKDAGTGGFMTLNRADKTVMSKQDAGFAIAVAKAYPGEVLMDSVTSFARQTVTFGLNDFSLKAWASAGLGQNLPKPVLAWVAATPGFRGQMPTTPVIVTSSILCLVSLGGVIWLLATARGTAGRTVVAMTAILLVGVAVNAAVCGILSGPHGRYQARVLFLVPLAALVLAEPVLRARRRGDATPAATADRQTARA